MKTDRLICDKCSKEFTLENYVGVYIVREHESYLWKDIERNQKSELAYGNVLVMFFLFFHYSEKLSQ